MKRSPIKRGTPLRPGRRRGWDSTLAPGTKAMKRSKPLRQTRHRKCWRHLRDEPYKKWVRSLGCWLRRHADHECRGRVEFSHVQNEGTGGPDRGNGIPLCASAHRLDADSWHRLGRWSWQAKYNIDAAAIASALASRAPVVSAPPREVR